MLGNFSISYHCNEEGKSKVNKPNLCALLEIHKADGMELVSEDAEITKA